MGAHLNAEKKVLIGAFVLCMVVSMLPAIILTAHAADAYLWPVPAGKTLSRGYSSGHTALDITSGGVGTSVVATKSGTVVITYTGCGNFNAWGTGRSCSTATCAFRNSWYDQYDSKMTFCNWGYGNGVIIRHSDGSGYSMYAHMSRIDVSQGATVNQGDVLGTMGSAGKSTGAHLHFELCSNVSIRGTYYDPAGYSINNNIGNVTYVDQIITSQPTVTFSAWNSDGYTYVRETDASIGQEIYVSNGNCTETGMYLYDANGRELASAKNTSYTIARVYFKINEECHYTLTPGTTYKYNFYAIVNGKTYWGNEGSFTTTGTAPGGSVNTKTSMNFGSGFYAIIRNSLGNFALSNASDGNSSTCGNVQIEYENPYDPRQVWYFVWDSDRGAYKIISEYDGRCLDVLNGLDVRFTNIGMWESNDGTPQRWKLVRDPADQNTYFNLFPICTNQYVADVEEAWAVAGTNVRIDQQWHNDAQRFAIAKLEGLWSYPKPAKPATPTFSSLYG